MAAKILILGVLAMIAVFVLTAAIISIAPLLAVMIVVCAILAVWVVIQKGREER